MFSGSVLGKLKLEFFESIIAWFLALISLFVRSPLSVLSEEVTFSGFLMTLFLFVSTTTVLALFDEKLDLI